jgi:hypothetical protein
VEFHKVIIDSTSQAASTSQSTTVKTAASQSSNNGEFEAQLSTALAESLQKLGVGSGEINISIKNPTPTTRQILVTYSVDGSPVTTPTASEPAAAATSASSTNPFSTYTEYVAPTEVPKADPTAWAPYSGPRDVRDELAAGGGLTTESGAPLIRNNDQPAKNQYGYTGPATNNPYFTTPSNPLREGYVTGFNKWFENPMILGGLNGPVPANKMQYSTEEGSQEALRIVQQFVPEATVVKSTWQSGPYVVDKPIYEVELADGRRLNAGGVLTGYYNQGFGVTVSSDETIRRSIQLA